MTTTTTLARLLSLSLQVEKAGNAPMFSLEEYNRLCEDRTFDIDAEQKTRRRASKLTFEGEGLTITEAFTKMDGLQSQAAAEGERWPAIHRAYGWKFLSDF